MSDVIDYDSKLLEMEEELCRVNSQIQKLNQNRRELIESIDKLKEEKQLLVSKKLGEQNWERSDFDWSERLVVALQAVFGISSFRPQQLSAMNATLAKNHAIVVMPTGAGKSPCYQLPAIISKGITVVVSPLISLIEDQIMSLKRKSVEATLMSSTNSRESIKSALNDMVDKNSKVKLLYVTPERFAKSKLFMARLQKCYAEGRLQRIAIDEVHCCSQWGHDFRPDYKFLGVLSSMFPDVPILGLTATATSRVIVDIQKMLDIRGCLLIKSSFNRPNIFYRIISKPSSSEECLDLFEKLLNNRYRNQSGIIYATSIKDCTDLAQGLRKRGLKVGCYHANLEPAQRSAVHLKWTEKYYQAIVATVAFGLGIDKPDVRFVLHHSLSKAMESYYQESGRAGRDGERAECIMMYRMQDIFRVSTMVFSSSGSLEHLYGMVRYCLEPFECRRRIIAKHFDEEWKSEDCNNMCDRCYHTSGKSKEILIQNYCKDIYKIIKQAADNDIKLTAIKLIEAWYEKGPIKLRVSSIKPPTLTKTQGEAVIAFLIIEGYLREDFHFTAYNTISYIKIGPKSSLFNAKKEHCVKFVLKNFDSFDYDCLAPKDLPAVSTSKDIKKISHDDSSEDLHTETSCNQNNKSQLKNKRTQMNDHKHKSKKIKTSREQSDVQLNRKSHENADSIVISD